MLHHYMDRPSVRLDQTAWIRQITLLCTEWNVIFGSCPCLERVHESSSTDDQKSPSQRVFINRAFSPNVKRGHQQASQDHASSVAAEYDQRLGSIGTKQGAGELEDEDCGGETE